MPAGRPRKPTALHELQGTGQKSRMNGLEPVLANRLPDRPSWIEDDKLASGLYDQVVQYVHNMGIATEVDGLALSILADQLSIYIEMRSKIREEGTIIEVVGSQGQVKKIPHPCLGQMQATVTTVHRFLREYGLTASSRPNVSTIDKATEVSSFDDFMNL